MTSTSWKTGLRLRLPTLEPKLDGLEDEYRQHFLREDAKQWAILIALWQIPVVGTARFDYILFGWSLPFYLLILGRSVFFGYCVAAIFSVRKIRNPKTFDKLAISVPLLGILLELSVNYTRPPAYTAHLVLNVLIVVACYLAWPNTLLVRILPAVVVTVGDIAQLLFLKTPTTPNVLNIAVISFVLAHALGIIVSIRLNNYRRGQFKAQKELEKAQQVLAERAATDPLTGILNRRKFMELAENEFNRFQRYRRPLTAMIFDLDHFKEINDDFGHHAGDEVLMEFARMVMKEKRESDLFGRLGGEEFGLLLPETSLEFACKVSERLRQRCENIRIDRVPRGITCSIGVAKAREQDATFDDLIRRADIFLYLAKEGGRNRVEAG